MPRGACASPAMARPPSPSGTPTSSPSLASPRRCRTASIRRSSPTLRATTLSMIWSSKKLAALHIPPSPACTDAEFIRRAYLDAAGILPTPDEVRNSSPTRAKDKRAKLIDDLLKRPEFVDYWTYKWSDLLLVSTRKLPQPAVWAFHQFDPPERSPTTSRGTASPATSSPPPAATSTTAPPTISSSTRTSAT